MGTACCGPAFCAPGCGLWPTLAMSRFVSELQSPGKRWLVAGLGNPGLPGTRHSVGLAVLGQLARRLGVAESWVRDSSCAADLALAPLGDAQLVLLRPRMNAGRSVARAAELFGLTAEEVYLVHDELDKPLGKLALKLGGSARGHNGVRSCISCLNSSVSNAKAAVGIGRPVHPGTVEGHVLGYFSPEEQELLPPLLESATDLLLDHIQNRSQAPSPGP
ncbi:Putative peptidyl-tRNA hydrolase [Heterocephalus glaber]|uniref:peptidyl-tRNA hydrolase n=1 Tax=Heterocephalus glaber TaxID=10181 RepID=G5BLG8_HETGA|nr:Putative peptidyl-tRNA hydrolase [Heterocephalus glaber]